MYSHSLTSVITIYLYYYYACGIIELCAMFFFNPLSYMLYDSRVANVKAFSVYFNLIRVNGGKEEKKENKKKNAKFSNLIFFPLHFPDI